MIAMAVGIIYVATLKMMAATKVIGNPMNVAANMPAPMDAKKPRT